MVLLATIYCTYNKDPQGPLNKALMALNSVYLGHNGGSLGGLGWGSKALT